MADDEFVRAFEACEIPGADFHHRDHIRLAWIYHRRYGNEAGERIAASIRVYAAHLGVSEKYHETITRAWMLLVAAASEANDFETGDFETDDFETDDFETDDFESFVAHHPELLEKSLLDQYYSAATLKSDAARERFLPADLKSLPKLGRSPAGVLK